MFRKALIAATFATAGIAMTPTSASAQWNGYSGGYRDDGRPRWMHRAGPASYDRGGYYPERRYTRGYRSRVRYYQAPRRHYRYRRHRCSGTTGMIVGAMAGGLLGHSIGHRHRTTKTILGAGLGALAGREIGRATC